MIFAKGTVLTALLTVLISIAKAQYYYKDIIGTKESAELIKNLKKARVTKIKLASFNEASAPIEDFLIEQEFTAAAGLLTTRSSTGITAPSQLATYADAAGNVIKTVDSSENIVSTTAYTYNGDSTVAAIISTTGNANGSESEAHLWQYRGGRPYRMLRIKNGRDTTTVSFVLDDKGNVIEERETRKGITTEPVYYYYNEAGRLTDIVRYNNRAGRLLPEYMFEYSDKGQVIQKITVPANNSEYSIWRYQYSGWGLKTKEAVYNKQKKLTGKIEYLYTFGSK